MQKKTDTKPPELFYSGVEDTVSERVTPQAETPNTETDDVLQSVGDGVHDVPNTRTEELTPHPSPDGDTFPSRGRQNDASTKERQKTAATPKRAAKKKTAERGNDK